jgi:hypothetical protein
MEIEVRIFVFDDEGEVRPLDKKRYDEAVEHTAAIPEFSNRRIKLAGAMLRQEEGQPAVLHEVYGQYVYFDQEGFVGEEKLAEATCHTDKLKSEGYSNPFVWQPSDEDVAKIKAALG